MPKRNTPLLASMYYHLYDKTVAHEQIFTLEKWRMLFLDLLGYHMTNCKKLRYSDFQKLSEEEKQVLLQKYKNNNEQRVEILAYALMPNHFHLLVKQTVDNGVSSFMQHTLNSFVKTYNTTNKRIGPLFLPNFRSKIINTDEQLLQTIRYIHLNAFKSKLISKDQIFKSSLSSAPFYAPSIEKKLPNNLIRINKVLQLLGMTKTKLKSFIISGIPQIL